MKRILLLVSACLALGAAGCCCCHGQNSCVADSGYNNGCYNNGGYDDGCQQSNCNQHRHGLFHKRNRDCADNDCSDGNGKCRLKNKRCRNKSPGHVCNADCNSGGNCDGMNPCCDVQLGDAGCCGSDCGNVMQTGGCGCGNTTFDGSVGAPTGGCASGNCGSGVGAPTPVAPRSTTSTQPYDELQALQAAGWTVMPTQGNTSVSSSPTLSPTPTFSAPPVPSSHISEPVPAPPSTASQNFVAPVRPAGSR